LGGFISPETQVSMEILNPNVEPMLTFHVQMSPFLDVKQLQLLLLLTVIGLFKAGRKWEELLQLIGTVLLLAAAF